MLSLALLGTPPPVHAVDELDREAQAYISECRDFVGPVQKGSHCEIYRNCMATATPAKGSFCALIKFYNTPSPCGASNPDTPCCGKVKTSFNYGCSSDESGESGIHGILVIIIQIMVSGVGITAVGGIAWAALLYTSADADPGQVKRAKDIIRNVVIGIIAFGLMYLGLNWLIPGGIFT